MKQIEDVIKEAESTNGVYSESAVIAQTLKAVMRKGRNWESLPADSKETLERVATHISRILAGDPNEVTHWNAAAAAFRVKAMSLDSGVEAGIERITRRLRTIPSPNGPEGVA